MTMKQIAIRCLCIYLFILASVDGRKRWKRIIGGRDLPDHNLYNTQFVVSLQRTHACIIEGIEHHLTDCLHFHACGGSLIAVDFVLTACHCVSSERWYSLTPEDANWKPSDIRTNITPGDFPPYIADRILNKPRGRDDPMVYRFGVRVNNPLHSALTVFAGHPESRNKAPQRRHAAKFFVHHLCATEQMKTFRKQYPQLWANRYYVLDVGLVKTCLPFRLNKDVQLAPFKPASKLEEQLRRLTKTSTTCLIVGWGRALPRGVREIAGETEATISPNILQHTFRYIQCNRDCVSGKNICDLCSRHHGPKLAATRGGDSGSPVICDGYVTAVHTSGMKNIGWFHKNYSMAIHVAVACVKDFITEKHLADLRLLTKEPFHYADGEPVTGLY